MSDDRDEQAEAQSNYEAEEGQIEHEEEEPHTAGDLPTMLIIAFVVVGAIIHSLLILLFVGKGIAGPEAWNLGWPPTGPN